MRDTDLMPFGKYKKEDDGECARLLTSFGCAIRGVGDLLVKSYIEENLTALLKECPDYIT